MKLTKTDIGTIAEAVLNQPFEFKFGFEPFLGPVTEIHCPPEGRHQGSFVPRGAHLSEPDQRWNATVVLDDVLKNLNKKDRSSTQDSFKYVRSNYLAQHMLRKLVGPRALIFGPFVLLRRGDGGLLRVVVCPPGGVPWSSGALFRRGGHRRFLLVAVRLGKALGFACPLAACFLWLLYCCIRCLLYAQLYADFVLAYLER